MNAKTLNKSCWGQYIFIFLTYHPTDYLLIINRKNALTMENSSRQQLNQLIKLCMTNKRTQEHHVSLAEKDPTSPLQSLCQKSLTKFNSEEITRSSKL